MGNDGSGRLARTERARSGRLLLSLAAALTIVVPNAALAANSCNSNLFIDYVSGPGFASPVTSTA